MKTRRNIKNKRNKTKKRIFTKKNYDASDGMTTYAWGPALWHSIHMISFNYPVKPTSNEKKHYFTELRHRVLIRRMHNCRPLHMKLKCALKIYFS